MRSPLATRPCPARQICIALVVSLSLGGTAACETARAPVQRAPLPPPSALGEITAVDFSGPPTRAIVPGEVLTLDVEVEVQSSHAHDDVTDLALGARLLDAEGRSVGAAQSTPELRRDRRNSVRLELGIDEAFAADVVRPDPSAGPPTVPNAGRETTLELFLLPTPDGAAKDPLRPRSRRVRIPLELTAPRDAPPVARVVQLEPEIGDIGEIELCEDGRVVATGQRGIATVSAASTTVVTTIDVPDVEARVRSLLVDWRCTRAYAIADDRLIVANLLDGEVVFDERVEGLVDIVHDVNTRYVLLVLSDGRLKRYYLRDDEWSQFEGELGAPPLVDTDGRTIFARDDARLVFAAQGPRLCTLLDRRKVKSTCIELPVTPVALWLQPFGFADEAFAPHSRQRTARRYEADAEARSASPKSLGTVAILHDENKLLAFSIDGGFTLAAHDLGVEPRTLRSGPRGTVIAVGARSRQRVALLDSGPGPVVPYVDAERLVPDRATYPEVTTPPRELWASPDGRRIAWIDARGVHVATRRARRIAFCAGHEATPHSWRWSTDGALLVTATNRAIQFLWPRGVHRFGPTPDASAE